MEGTPTIEWRIKIHIQRRNRRKRYQLLSDVLGYTFSEVTDGRNASY